MRRVGDLLFISGCSSRRPDGTHRGSVLDEATGKYALDIAEQTAGVLENIQSLLSHVGASLHHIVDLQVFLVDMKDYAEMNKVYNRYFDASNGPTRTCVAVHQLPHPNLLIELKAIASFPQKKD